MDPTIILGAIILVPIIVLMTLKVNAAQVFLSLCLGSVLVQFLSSDAAVVAGSASAQSAGVPAATQSTVNLILLLLPVILTTIFMIHSVKGRSRLALNLLPAIGVGALIALLAVPLLPSGVTMPIIMLPWWTKLQNLQALIIGVSALLALLVLWMQRPKAHHEASEK